MRILVATDAWHPQVNGVVHTYLRLAKEARAIGVEIDFLTPEHFRSFPCPGYPEIRLAVPNPIRARRLIDDRAADFIHIATEGPVGWMARSYCRSRGRPFTTSYHTKFPEYAAALISMPPALAWAPVRSFHSRSAGIMVATPSLARELSGRGFKRIMAWTRGVDMDLFHPRSVRLFGAEAPVFLYAGRVSKEKSIEDFLAAELPGRKVVVGDGPHLATLKRRYPEAIFTGMKCGEELAECYASADVFVFPSKTDTFGLVILEAMASGLPVAAYPVTGPIDIVEDGISGILDQDLASAARRALVLDRAATRRRAMKFTWANATQLFIDNIRTANARAQTEATDSAATRSGMRSSDRTLRMTSLGDSSP